MLLSSGRFVFGTHLCKYAVALATAAAATPETTAAVPSHCIYTYIITLKQIQQTTYTQRKSAGWISQARANVKHERTVVLTLLIACVVKRASLPNEFACEIQGNEPFKFHRTISAYLYICGWHVLRIE